MLHFHLFSLMVFLVCLGWPYSKHIICLCAKNAKICGVRVGVLSFFLLRKSPTPYRLFFTSRNKELSLRLYTSLGHATCTALPARYRSHGSTSKHHALALSKVASSRLRFAQSLSLHSSSLVHAACMTTQASRPRQAHHSRQRWSALPRKESVGSVTRPLLSC